MRWLFFIPALGITLLLVWQLDSKIGDIPPLGKFFSPFTGFWQNNEEKNTASATLDLPGLKDEVIVHFDDNLVPHIFAKNNYDLYYAQGYITAKYRLWQMEFQTLAAAGRISEIIGEKALEYDRQQRRYGMVYGAEKTLAEMKNDPESYEAALAYAEGINALIASLSQKELPVEYKILDYKPEPWTVLKSALLLKYMTYDLAGRSDDFYVTNVLKKYGQAAIDSLFENRPFVLDPIIPAGTRWDFQPVPAPPSPPNLLADSFNPPFRDQPHPDNGSNNWAVSGSKTSSGSPILCGDPHLSLNLPSLWYQVQLVSPDVNVTGVSLPGTPCVIIGFNQNIAWSETNVDADVLDWYSIKFKDASRAEYFYNNEWKAVTRKVEVIKIRGAKDVLDTVLYTHHGPVVATEEIEPLREFVPKGYAMRWLGHNGTSELKAFFKLNRAKNYDEYVNALSFFECPAQNFVYADIENNIALWVNGKYPLKWKGQGKFLMDGSDPMNEWQGWVPHDHDPHVKNPGRAFVSSANQTPADSLYPYYLNWRFETFTRGYRINEKLGSMDYVTPDSMRLLQFDDKNVVAEKMLPVMVSMIDQNGLNDHGNEILGAMQQWNFRASPESTQQTVFNMWWHYLKVAIWNDELGTEDMMYPETDISMRTVAYNINHTWIDNQLTPQAESLDELVNESFHTALDSLRNQMGSDWTQWKWAEAKRTRISHLLRIPAFSKTFVSTGGSSGIVNATGTDHGASWRMIVALGKDMQAFGIYPGGQSGNPGSPFYDNMIDGWSKGQQNELCILKSVDEKNPRIISTLKLQQQ